MRRDSFSALSSLVGNTPLLEIRFRFHGTERCIYAKAEHMNFTGSIKDRMALEIIRRSSEEGFLKSGDHIVEATSGNTGIAFAAIGRALGHPVTIFMPDWMSEERKNLIRGMGANIRLVSHKEGGFRGSIDFAEAMARENEGVFLPRQFENQINVDAHERTTGPEIWFQLQARGIKPNAFVAGVGTGGTVMGVGKFLRSKDPSIRIFPLEPSNSPTLTTGYKVGKHRIQGISDEFIPPIVKLHELDEVVSVDDGDAILMAQKLATTLGIGVGISSGANFLGAIRVQEMLGNNACVVTVFSDDNKKYLSTGLFQQEPIKSEFLSTNVELLDFKAFMRVCETCCNPSLCADRKHAQTDSSKPLSTPPRCPRRGC